jgi:hypothetical protein
MRVNGQIGYIRSAFVNLDYVCDIHVCLLGVTRPSMIGARDRRGAD